MGMWFLTSTLLVGSGSRTCVVISGTITSAESSSVQEDSSFVYLYITCIHIYIHVSIYIYIHIHSKLKKLFFKKTKKKPPLLTHTSKFDTHGSATIQSQDM